MKRKQHLISAAIAAVLTAVSMTGCGGNADSTPAESSVTGDSAVTQTETTVGSELTSETELTTEQSAALTTDAALTESTTVTTASTAPQARRDDWLDSIGTLTEGYVAQLRCTGTVYASDGLNLRKKPGTASEKLAKLKNGSKLEITGITANDSVTDYNNRWLRVYANGQEGYVLAEYVNAQCSIPLSQLTGEEIGAMAVLFYYQAERLDMIYRREGGLQAQGLTEEYDSEGFARVKPDGLTIEKIRTDYHRWFTADTQDDFDQLYVEKNNAVWVMTGYGDNVALEYAIPEKLKERTDNSLTYEVRAQWFPEFDMTMDGSNTNLHDFELVYTDGVWKVDDFKAIY